MEVRPPTICRVHQVSVGSLFVLLERRKGNAICLKAAYNIPDDPDEANRVIPLHWPGDSESVGAAIYATALSADAIVLEDARLEVNPLSGRAAPEGSVTAVYARDGRLFFPIKDNGKFGGLVDASSGEILDHTGGNYAAFDEWYISVGDDWLNRELIYPVESDESERP